MISELINPTNNVIQLITYKIIIPLTVFFLGISLGAIISKNLQKLLLSIEVDQHSKKIIGPISITEIITTSVKIIIYTFTTIISLKLSGLINIILKIIIIFFSILATISIVLLLIDTATNIINRKNVKIGDEIAVSGIKGRVISTGINYVHITDNKFTYAVPWRKITKTQ